MTAKSDSYERRMEMMFLMFNIKKTTVSTLAKYFSVTRNTIVKDLGVVGRYAPIYTRRGKFGGVFLLEGYKSDVRFYLSVDEKALLEQLAKKVKVDDARLLRNILHKYSMPQIDV